MNAQYSLILAQLSEFQRLMVELDVALTGNEPERILGQIHHYPTSFEKWLSENEGDPIWYLSDGGYSRVGYNLEHRNIYLTSNSQLAVKCRWEEAQEQAMAVEDHCHKEYDRMLAL